MKIYIYILALTCYITSSLATNYYVSPTGNDSNNGTTMATPWKTMAKVNSSMANFVAGDVIAFQKGGVYVGTITISNKKGNAENFITFTSYGEGEKPILRASQRIYDWKLEKTNIWKADVPALLISNKSTRIPSLFINNIPQQIGREPDANAPNGGYRTINDHSANNTQISEATNLPYPENTFAGAEIVIRTNRDFFNHETIVSHSGKSINLTTTQTDPAILTIRNKFGYIIQNHINTLNLDGEWAHDIENKKLYLYSTVDPNTRNIEIPQYNNVLNITSSSFIKIADLRLENAAQSTLSGSNWISVVVDGCEIINSAEYGTLCYTLTNSQFINSKIDVANSVGMRWEGCSNVLISNNLVQNIGLRPGMGGSSYIPHTGLRLVNSSTGETSTIQKNTVTQIGYHGVVTGNNILTKQNDISFFCKIKDDGGGIYMAGNTKALLITQNFVHDAPGAFFGAPEGEAPKTAGIYIDNNSTNKTVFDNTVYNIGAWGIMANLSGNNIFKDNLTYNCGIGLILNTYNNNFGTNGTAAVSENNTSVGNVLVAGSNNQYCAKYSNSLNPTLLSTNLGKLDSNYYVQPFENGKQIRVDAGVNADYTLHQFKTTFPKYEANAQNGPPVVNSINEIRFEPNYSNKPNTITLGTGNYKDAKGTYYTGDVTIPAYKSTVLFLQTKTIILGQESPNYEIKMYPNPSSNQVYISGLKQGDIIQINTAQGKTIYSKKASETAERIQLEGCIPGVYVVVINEKVSKKLIIQ